MAKYVRDPGKKHSCVAVMESVNTQYTDFLHPVSTVCMQIEISASYIIKLSNHISFYTRKE